MMRTLLLMALLLGAGAAFAAPKLMGQVNINSASAQQLCLLPGIGPKRAEAIIALRERRPFRRAVQLRRIRGIGRRTMMKLKPYVRVDGETNLKRF